ncbi:MAG: phage tail family protein [Proteobacteria bacterium]|nr:phage tail family protein [Pseudomonadota bacterium]
MSLILTDTENVTFYTFPAGFDLHAWRDRDFTTRSKMLERFGAHGGREISDRAVEPRRVSVKGAFHAGSQAALKTFLDSLSQALHHNGEAYRFSWEAGFYANVSHVDEFRVDRFEAGLAFRSVNIEIRFVCPDPFWYSVTDDTAAPVSITQSPQNISFTSSGGVPAPLKVQCDPTAAWADFTLENVTDDGNLFRYADSALVSGTCLVVDATDGTVKRDGLSTIRHYSGAFLRVLPGENTLRYTGPTGGGITFSAPRRFL